MDEYYISVDVEADGPVPGKYSMLSFGAAAFKVSKSGCPTALKYELVSTYEANLEVLPEAGQDPKTMQWWAQPAQRAAWEKARTNTRSPNVIMPEFVKWIESIPGTPVFVGYPASFDFNFIYWYLIVFAEESPFGFSALDMKSFGMVLLNSDFKQTVKRKFPKYWMPTKNKHEHVALADAIEQGHIFMKMLMEREDLHDELEKLRTESRLAYGGK